MDLKQFIADDDAVSPVIGVILMVAITVILAAVIGTFVLGLGDQVQDSAPNVNFEYNYDTTADTVEITHDGGQNFEASNVVVQADTEISGDDSNSAWGSGSVSTGQSTPAISVANTDTVRIVWEAPSGGSSQTIGESDVPA